MELKKFVQAIYTLEGDGSLVFIAFQKLEELSLLSAFIHVQNFPTLAQAIHNVFPMNVAEQQKWYQCALGEFLAPAFQYYYETVINQSINNLYLRVYVYSLKRLIGDTKNNAIML